MEAASLFQLSRDLTAQIQRLVSSLPLDDLPPADRELLRSLSRQAADVRLDVRDYGMAETAAEQQRLAQEAAERLKGLEEMIARAGGQGLLGPADVAQLSAVAQQLIAVL